MMLYMIKNRGGGGGEEICKMKSSRRSASNFTLPPPCDLDCEGTNQCIFVMFPSPQPMWNIFQASTGDFPVTSSYMSNSVQEGGEKCKIDMSGYQTMHICDVFKPSANVCNISGWSR